MSASEARAGFDSVKSALDLQTEIPVPKVKVERPPESRTSRALISRDTMRTILWVSVAVLVVFMLFVLRNSLWSASRARKLQIKATPQETPSDSIERLEQAGQEADELARNGSFTEAMHILLLQSLTEMRRRLDVSIAASLTSREILYRVELSSTGRSAFSDIIRRVEVSYFGFHQPGADDYAACRASFETFKSSLRRGGGSRV